MGRRTLYAAAVAEGAAIARECGWYFARCFLPVFLWVAALFAIALLAGCAHDPPEPVRIVETVRVEVPVPVRRDAPPELLRRYQPEALPVFLAPDDPRAVVALDTEGERRLRAILSDLYGRLEAWRAWATAPP